MSSGAPTRALIHALLLTGMALSAACNRSQRDEPAEEGTTAEQERIEITSVTLGRTLGPDMRIASATTSFRPLDTIYASIATEGAASGATLSARWTYEDGQVIDESSRTIAPNGPEVTEFHISKPDGWPLGDYEVAISLNGTEVERTSFTVGNGG